MGSNNFDQIAQKIIEQKHLMDKLEEENRELRQQISDLKTGRGIFVEIEGRRMALIAPGNAATSGVPEASAARDSIQSSDQQQEQAPKIAGVDQQPAPPEQGEKDKQEANSAPSFLEEVLLDEFSSALTMSVESVQQLQSKQKEVEGQQKEAEGQQEQKERLRRELMGSYLLE